MATKITLRGGNANDFLGPSEFFQFMQMIQNRMSPPAHEYMRPGWTYEVKDEVNEKIVYLIKPDLSGHLREKIAALRGQRTSRLATKKKVEKMTQGVDPALRANVVKMYESMKNGLPILNPTEALADREKYRPIVEQLTKEYPREHPLTAYYSLLFPLLLTQS